MSMSMTDIAISIAAADVGAAGVISFLQGQSFTDVALSLNGGLGAGLGYTVGMIVAPKISQSAAVNIAVPFAGAAAVPGLVGGQWDADVLLLAAGAVAGTYLVQMIYQKTQKQ